MLLATLIHRASLPCPQVGHDQAARLLEQYYGLTGIASAQPGNAQWQHTNNQRCTAWASRRRARSDRKSVV